MAEELVEKVRYEADISDIQAKLATLSAKQSDIAGDTEKHTGRMKKAWGGFKDSLANGGAWFAGIAGAAGIAIPKILDQGATLDSLDKKAKTVFSGTSINGVQSWATKVAGSFGLTTSQAVNLAAGMGDLFKPMGFTSDQAAAMATQLGDLSGALSAWSGGQQDASQVADTITKAMLGERDGLKSLGISISQTEVDSVLAAKGQDKLTGAALAQAQALATQQLIMEKSTDAQKAWADGSMDGVKSQNESKASLKQLGETLVRAVYPVLQKLVPIVSKVAEWIGDRLPGALKTAGKILSSVFEGGKRLIGDLAKAFGTSEGTIKKVLIGIAAGLIAVAVAWNAGPGLIVTAIVALVAGFLWAYENVDWFRKGVQVAFAAVKVAIGIVVEAIKWLIDKIVLVVSWIGTKLQPVFQKIAGFITQVVVPAFQMIWQFISQKVIPVFQAIASKIGEVAGAVGSKIADIVGFVVGIPGRIGAVISTLWNGLKTGITAAKDWVRDRINDVVNFAVNLPTRIANVFSGMWDGIKDAFKSALNWIIDKWNGLEFKFPEISAFGVTVGGFTIGLPDIPKFHSGGITNFGSAGEGLALLRNNEAVVPLDDPGRARQLVGGTTINGDVHIHTPESPRRWYDESMWRVA